jgi:S-layer family protein
MKVSKHFLTALLVLGVVAAGCSSGQQSTTEASASPMTSGSPGGYESASPGASGAIAGPIAVATQAVTYTDIAGAFGQDQITQLAQLGVFGDASGTFNAAGPILRRDFARWLFKANNAIWANDTSKQVHPAQGESSSFSDVKTSDPDFQYIQGLQDAGISVGFPDNTFKPDIPITHEQAVAIKSALDRGGVDKEFTITKTQPVYGYESLPSWKDKHDISPEYVGAIATGTWADSHFPDTKVDNVGRSLGAIAAFKPKQPLTRGQAAMMLWKIGPHAGGNSGQAPRTAAIALQPGGGASPTP